MLKAMNNELDYFLQNNVLEVAMQKLFVKEKRRPSPDFATEQTSGLMRRVRPSHFIEIALFSVFFVLISV